MAMMLLAIFGVVATAQEKKVAVFDPAGNADNNVIGIVREEISSVIVNTKGYRVVERELINKVFAENRFQGSGLVDESQYVEMGKIAGANLVLVSTVSLIGSNYHLSCKLIDVQTAQIQKQRTSLTQQGVLNELIEVVQKTMKDMFIGAEMDEDISQQPNYASISSNTVSDIPPKTLVNYKSMVYYGDTKLSEYEFKQLRKDGEAFRQLYGNVLMKYEVRQLMAGTDALRIYNKSRRKANNCWWWYGLGLAANVTGIVNEANNEFETALGCYAVALVGYIVTISMAKKSAKLVGKAVDTYNESLNINTTIIELKFGFTVYGIGLALRF